MATIYKWKIMSNKAIKQQIKKDDRLLIKEKIAKDWLFRKNIRFIWPKPRRDLFEGKIIADLGEKYKVIVKSRRSKWDYVIMEELKNRINFEE